MPANKRSARRSKSFKRCSRQGRPGCSRKKKSCTWDSRRRPRCQPKGSRKKSDRKPSRRKASKKKAASSALGGLMSPKEFEQNRKDRMCATEKDDDNPHGCAEDCAWDKTKKRCVSKEAAAVETLAKFMDGSKYLTFRSNKKPAFSFRIPINPHTLYGEYSGAIRFSPSTGKLHLCYGPLHPQSENANRPVLAMLVKPKLSENLWSWYLSSGRNLQKKRIRDADGSDMTYTDLYSLPGASYQLTYSEAMFLEDHLKHLEENVPKGMKPEDIKVTTIEELAMAPTSCPPVIGDRDVENGCLESSEFGRLEDLKLSADEDYNQFAVLGHAPNKRQSKLVEEYNSSDSEGTPKKKGKKKSTKPKPVRSPIPEKFKEAGVMIDEDGLTNSLRSERLKGSSGDASTAPTRQCVFFRDSPDVDLLADVNPKLQMLYLAPGFENLPQFSMFKKLITTWRDCTYNRTYNRNKGVSTENIGGTVLDMHAVNKIMVDKMHTEPEDIAEFDDRNIGINTVITLLKDFVSMNNMPVAQVETKKIIDFSTEDYEGKYEESKIYEKGGVVIDFVHKLVLFGLQGMADSYVDVTEKGKELEAVDVMHFFRYQYISSLGLAFLAGLQEVTAKSRFVFNMEKEKVKDFMNMTGGDPDALREDLIPLSFAGVDPPRKMKEITKDLTKNLGSGCISAADFGVFEKLFRKIGESARCERPLLTTDFLCSLTKRKTQRYRASARARRRAREYLSSDSDSD